MDELKCYRSRGQTAPFMSPLLLGHFLDNNEQSDFHPNTLEEKDRQHRHMP